MSIRGLIRLRAMYAEAVQGVRSGRRLQLANAARIDQLARENVDLEGLIDENLAAAALLKRAIRDIEGRGYRTLPVAAE